MLAIKESLKAHRRDRQDDFLGSLLGPRRDLLIEQSTRAYEYFRRGFSARRKGQAIRGRKTPLQKSQRDHQTHLLSTTQDLRGMERDVLKGTRSIRERRRFMQIESKKRVILTALSGAVWLVMVGFGLRALLSYESSPASAGAPPQEWPAQSRIERASNRATLLMLVHPHCPCTRASIGELAELMAHVQGKVSACVLFLKPQGSPEDWEKTDLWRSAAAIPGVTVLCDNDGIEARRFHIETSGHVLLFEAKGRLLFSGGITASRGHSGDNAGRDTIVSLLVKGAADRNNTLVFGCSLFNREKPENTTTTLCTK